MLFRSDRQFSLKGRSNATTIDQEYDLRVLSPQPGDVAMTAIEELPWMVIFISGVAISAVIVLALLAGVVNEETKKSGWHLPSFSRRVLLYRLSTAIGCLIMLPPILVFLPVHLVVEAIVSFYTKRVTSDPSSRPPRDFTIQKHLLMFLKWEEFCHYNFVLKPQNEDRQTFGDEEQGHPSPYSSSETLVAEPVLAHSRGFPTWETTSG